MRGRNRFHWLRRAVAFAALAISCSAQPLERRESSETAAPSPDPFAPGIAPRAFPSWIWEMEPEAAARKCLDAIPASGNGDSPAPVLRPPGSGWIIVEDTTSTCFTAGGTLLALHHGVDEPYLVRLSTRGAPDPSALGQRVIYHASIIPLSREEANRIAALAFWLAKLDPDFKAGGAPVANPTNRYLGRAEFLDPTTLTPPPEITMPPLTRPERPGEWQDGSAYGRWIHRFFTQAVPARLRDRWNGPGNHATLLATITKLVERNQSSPLPASLLSRVLEIAGDAGLDELRGPLAILATNLPRPGPEEEELQRIRKQIDATAFNSPFGDVTADPAALRRAMQLGEKFRYHPAFQVRGLLADVLQKLDALQNAAELVKMTETEGPFSWAERMLLDRYPAEHARYLTRQFEQAAIDRWYTYARLVETNPVAAAAMRDSMTPEVQDEFLILNAKLDLILRPDQPSPRSDSLFRELQGGPDRTEAIRLLAKMRLSTDQASRLEAALLAELRGETLLPDTADSSVAPAVEFLVSRPDPDRFWEPLLAASRRAVVTAETTAFLTALSKLASAAPDRRMPDYQQWIASALQRGPYPASDLLDIVLALDLRGLSEDITSLAGTGTTNGSRIIEIWNETDPDTLAQMWTGMVKENERAFSGDDFISVTLRKRCGDAIGKASAETRDRMVANLREIDDPRPALSTWISGLHKASR